MKNWEPKLFKDIAQFPPKVPMEKGQTYSFIPMEEVSGNYKYVSPTNEKEWTGGGAKFENGDTLFARITPCLQNGKIAQAKDLKDGKGFGSTEYFIFRGIDNISDSDFIYYIAQTDEFRKYAIGSMVGASGRQRADAKFVGNFELKCPPLSTQRKIASILSAYDGLIENNLKRIKLLEEIAQRTYEEWFVKFRINGKQLKLNTETGLPEGWEKKKFKEVLNFKTGKLDSNAMIKGGIYDFYTCSKEIYKTNSYCFDGEAILLGGNNATGNFSLFYANGKFDAYQRTYIVTSKIKEISLVYTYYVLKNLLPKFQNVSSGAATKFLTMKILDSTEIVFPNALILENYFCLVKPLFDQTISLQKQNRLLKESRDILLPRLMSGVIEVK